MFCTSCGSEVPDQARFCTVCGTELRGAEVPAGEAGEPGQEETPKARRKLSKPAIIAIAAAVIVLAGSGVALGATGALAPDTPAEYSYKTVSLDDSGQEVEGGVDAEFSYIQVTCSKSNEKVDEVNELMKSKTQEAFAQKMDNSTIAAPASGEDPQMYYGTSAYHATYFKDGVACFLRGTYTIIQGAVHGGHAYESIIVNFDTGEDLTAAEFVGVPEDELRLMAWKAADAFLRAGGGLYRNASEAFGNGSASAGVPEEFVTFYLSPKGVVALFSEYSLVMYAMGCPELLVCDYEGNAIADGVRQDIEHVFAESGEMTGLTKKQRKEMQKQGEEGVDEGNGASEDAVRTEEERAATQAEREETAVAFVTQFYTNTEYGDPRDWGDAVEAYLEPGSEAVDLFEGHWFRSHGPGDGLGVPVQVSGIEIQSSSLDEVTVAVDVFPLMNNIDNETWHYVFVCHFAESGLVDSYSGDV